MSDYRQQRRRPAWRRTVVPLAASIALSGLLAGPGAEATTATNTFTVQAVINAACSVSATTLNFGTYDPASGTALSGTSTVNVSCTSGTPYTTSLDVGTAAGSSFTTRTIASGTNILNYNLYRDSARTQVWGDGTGSTFTVAGTGSGILTPIALTVYGQVPTAQDKPPGTYTSTITVTVTY
jgi:spore coat protein U domain-containing protein, fimbrial subunit CupE1/2/3/6